MYTIHKLLDFDVNIACIYIENTAPNAYGNWRTDVPDQPVLVPGYSPTAYLGTGEITGSDNSVTWFEHVICTIVALTYLYCIKVPTGTYRPWYSRWPN